MSHGRQSGTAQAGEQSLFRRAFGVGFRRETYANLAYLLARFPLGIAYFTVLVTGISLGLGLVPLVVGVPILAGVVALGGYIGVVEAGLLRRLRGSTVSVDLADPSDLSMTEYLKTVATDPRNYVLLAFGFGSFVVGIQLFVAITVVFSLGLAFAAAPLVYWRPGVDYNLADVTGTVELGGVSVDAGSLAGAGINTLPEALAASAVGIVVCLAGLHAVNLTAGLLGALTEHLLGISSK
jgi:hypothetical protein